MPLLLLLAGTPPEVAPVTLAWLPVEGIVLLQEGSDAPRAFDLDLRACEGPEAIPPRAPRATDTAAGAALELTVWSRRTLRFDPAEGSLRLGPAPWEHAPRLRWGPGWVCLEVRSADAAGSLLWRRAGEEQAQAAHFRCDRNDGLTQQAWIEGLDVGEQIEIRWRLHRPQYPAAAPPKWRRFTVPEVDPAGPRPSAAWPEG